MARLYNQILGDPSGTLGNMVFRIRKGADFIAKRPSPRSTAANNSELAFRGKFGLTGKIAQGINSVDVLKEVWPTSTGRASKFNGIFKANYKLINSAENPGSAIVAPVFGFNAANAVLTAGASGIHLVTDALGVNIGVDTGVEKFLVAAGIVVLNNPTLENIATNQVIPFKSNQHNLDLINPVDLTADFSGGTLAMYESYTDKKVFACLVTLDENGKAVHYSSTFNS